MNRDSAPLGADPRQAQGALRALLGEISAASQLLLRSAGERDRRYLAVISRGAFRCTRLVYEQELAFRLDSGEGLEAHMDTVDLVSWCREGCERAAALLEHGGIALRPHCTEPAAITVGDRELLDELLYELIANAAKAVGEGGEIRVSLAVQGDRAVLMVGDEGDGMTGDALAGLNDGGAAEPDLTPGAGAGLGLRLCRAIADVHGGRLFMSPGADAGTRATVTIPLREGERGRLAGGPMPDGADRALVALSDVLPVEFFETVS